MAILDLYFYYLNSEDKLDFDISSIFRSSELKRLFTELRFPRFFNEPLN